MDTVVITDCCCDLPYDYICKNKIEMLSLSLIIEGDTQKDHLAETQGYTEFYNKMRQGMVPTTSQINSYEYENKFMEHLNKNKKVLYIGFSSGLSGSINSALSAKKLILEKYPEAPLFIIDSKCASMGQGLLVYYGIEQIKKGLSIEEVVKNLEELKLKIQHWFTVSDLNYLFKGGRVSRSAMTIGTLLQIKPILTVDKEGKLVPVEKVKGRKKSIRCLLDKVHQYIEQGEKKIVFISHADALEEAEALKEKILQIEGVQEVMVNNIGATIGSHAGPGTLAVFFLGDKRIV